METIFGFTWPVPSAFDYILIFFLALLLLLVCLLLYLYYFSKNAKAQSFQLFLYKVRNLGLTTFKINILHAIVDSLTISNPNKILKNPLLFETAINRYNKYLLKHKEMPETIKAIFEEIIEIYQSIYYPSLYKKELMDVHEIGIGKLFRIIINDKYIIIGKVAVISDRIKISICTKHKNLNYKPDDPADVFFFRAGDAGYNFSSRILNIDQDSIELALPESIKRIKPVRRPDVDVEIKAILKSAVLAEDGAEEPGEDCDILKMNLDEIVINIRQDLDFSKEYLVQFDIEGITLHLKCGVLTVKKIKGNNTYYYTMKLKEVSEPVMKILNSYITEQLKK